MQLGHGIKDGDQGAPSNIDGPHVIGNCILSIEAVPN